MGVTLTAVANGDVMSSSIQRSNLTTVRDWLNGGIVTGDIANGALRSRHFRRMDHFGGSNPRSVGVTGTIWNLQVGDARVNRQYAIVDAQGPAVWDDIAGLQIRGYAPISGTIDIVSRGWYWPIRASSATANVLPEATTAADVRLAVGATGVARERRLWDSGHDTLAGDYAGQFLYGARNVVLFHQASVSAGWFDVSVQIKVLSQATYAEYGLTIVGSSSLTVEYHAK